MPIVWCLKTIATLVRYTCSTFIWSQYWWYTRELKVARKVTAVKMSGKCYGPPPPVYCGAFARLVSPGGGAFAKLHYPGARHLPTLGLFPSFWHTHGFLSEYNITAQKVLLEEKQIDLSVKDRNKLKRVIKTCSRFYACNSSLLIKPELRSEIGAINVN